MGSDRTKVILVVVLLLAAGGVYWFWGRPEPVLPNRVTFVDVATGEIINFSRADMPNILPGTNPNTETETLLPVEERDGVYFVIGRYGMLVRDPKQLGQVNKYIDPRTFQVLDTPLN
jgi:hypothetical protein